MASPEGEFRTKITLYGFYYDLDLFSDFTYFLTDPARGDQFEQKDNRWVAGLDAHHAIFSEWFGRKVENTFGVQVRNDWIHNGLFQTENRVRMDKTDFETGNALPTVTQADRVLRTRKQDFMRRIRYSGPTNSDQSWGFAAICNTLTVTSLIISANSGTASKFLPSPKASLIFGPWSKTEFHVQSGFSFHSNDGRGTTQTVEPIPGTTRFQIRPPLLSPR